jgi:hypothetical protein
LQGFLTGERMAFVSMNAFARNGIFVGIQTITFSGDKWAGERIL